MFEGYVQRVLAVSTMRFQGIRSMFQGFFATYFRGSQQNVSGGPRNVLCESPRHVPLSARNKFSGMLAAGDDHKCLWDTHNDRIFRESYTRSGISK